MYSNQQPRSHLPPIWKAKPDPVLHLKLYRNGDEFFPGKFVSLNQRQFRTFESWLADLSNNMRLTHGAVRRVYTPRNGTRCDNFGSLQTGQSLVLAGQERFKPLRYDQIISHERKRGDPFKYDASPVVHSRIFQSSGRIKRVENQSIIIKVWPNGGEKRARRPRVVLLRRTLGWNMAQVIGTVNDMLKDDCNGPVESLFKTNGTKLAEVNDLQHNGVYVALTRRDRGFKNALYNDFATKDLHTSPRPDRKTLDPLFSRSNNSTSNSSPEHSNASSSQNTNGHSRRRPPRKEEDQVFPAKPVKHSRNNDKARKVDLDKDEGGVFKARNSNQHTRGAREVNDTRQTRTDLPVDQQRAQEVEEDIPYRSKEEEHERIGRPPNNHNNNNNNNNNNNARRRPPPRAAAAPKKEKEKETPKEKEFDEDLIRDAKKRREKAATKIQAGYRGYNTRRQLTQSNTRQTSMTKSRPQSYQSKRTNSMSEQRPVREKSTDRSQVLPLDLDEEEKAATKIQAGFRGYQTRKSVEAKRAAGKESDRAREEVDSYRSLARDEVDKMLEDAGDTMDREGKAATKIQAGFRGHQVRKELQTKAARHESWSKNSEEEKAAVRIQAGVRGYQARKSVKSRKEAKAAAPSPAPKSPAKPEQPPKYDNEKEEDDEDEDDYDRAATKIQAGFRGYQARKNLRI